MKKYSSGRKTIIIALISSLLFSCSKSSLTENPKATITTNNFYLTSGDLESAMGGIALSLNFPFSLVQPIFYGGDDISVNRSGNKFPMSDFDIFQPTSSNSRNNTYYWNTFYATIKQSNELINNYTKATQATGDQKNNAAGYGYFTRAICYYFLTRGYGDIPMPLTNNNAALTNTKVADVYNQIVSDLKNAETMLPDHWSGLRVQGGIDVFPTKGSAKALLADVYLTMAGWPLKLTDHYALAASKAKEVIDNKTTWGYELLTNYGDLWKIGNKYNKETVFGCYFNNLTPDIWNTPNNWQNGNEMGPPSLAPADEGGWNDLYSEINFFKKFPEGPRKLASYQYIYYPNNDPSKAVDWTGTLFKHPYFLKYRDEVSYNWTTHVANDWWGSMTSYVIRYSQVLLTYAEAKAMSSSADATAYDAVNKVRNRAGLPNLVSGLSQTAFRDSVVAERGWEFAAEFGSRWFDLQRTETVGKANSSRDASEVTLTNTPDDANHTYYLAPLPITK